ncbi:S8 family serine peptidase [Streptomyces sp. NPDC088354]|uniref:S8 family serine peptidase n=1 Tax=Streptomyces sp. NPDC088354 TaxID=3365856 RepID=UPI00380B1ED1
MPTQLEAGADCTKASEEKATSEPWQQRYLQFTRASQFSSGSTVTVAVVDTGVSVTAPALKGRVIALGSAGQDCVGHGSFVAGLIGAAATQGVKFAGVAPQARIVAVRGTDARGKATASSVAAGITQAVQAKAQVIVVSPALANRSAQLTAAVDNAVKHDALLIAAAVPDPPRAGTASKAAPVPRDYWPAAQSGVLSVLDIDADGKRLDGALLPRAADLTAPGDGVISIGPRGTGHFIGSGASFGAAFVAGAAAQVRSAHPELSAEQTAARLISTAYPDVVPRLDPYAAVTAATTAAQGQSAVQHPLARDKPVVLPADAGALPMRRAALCTAIAGAVLFVLACAAVVVPRGRARGWQPAEVSRSAERG